MTTPLITKFFSQQLTYMKLRPEQITPIFVDGTFYTYSQFL